MEKLLACFKGFCLWIERWTHIPEQMWRFLMIGALNTAFAYGLYALFIFVGLHYTLAVLLSTVIGICFSFKTLGGLVFDNPDNRLIFKFFAVYTGCYFLNIFLLGLFSRYVWNNLYAAGLFSSLVVAAVSFCINKYFVFKK
ncbi:MAG: GtrA family protein [Elusimicrobiaceae bacterium]|nr:GtrA family protein [Elusimicrobiaceae bacterium]